MEFMHQFIHFARLPGNSVGKDLCHQCVLFAAELLPEMQTRLQNLKLHPRLPGACFGTA